MSDTPRTDQIEKLVYWILDDMTPVCESRFVRSLERELNSANTIIRQQQLLDEENLRLQERIKRLVKVGDYLDEHVSPVRENRTIKQLWLKAKEANP
jgi:hypothetical protein